MRHASRRYLLRFQNCSSDFVTANTAGARVLLPPWWPLPTSFAESLDPKLRHFHLTEASNTFVAATVDETVAL